MRPCFRGTHRNNTEEPIQAFGDDGALSPSPVLNTYLSLFKTCIQRKSLPNVRHLYAHLTHHGFDCDVTLGSFLVVALAKCGAIDDALCVSSRLPHRTVFSWAAIVCACVECSSWPEALYTFQRMEDDEVSPSAAIYASILKACSSLTDLTKGRILHREAVKRGYTSEFFVGNTLLSMYGKCDAVEDAEAVFRALPQRTVVSWTAMLSVYLEQSQGRQALQAYRQMLEDDGNPNQLTLVFALKACNILAGTEDSIIVRGDICTTKVTEIGRALHVFALRKNFACDAVVGTALLCLYGKCGFIAEAENVFEAVVLRDVPMWNSMLSTYKNQNLEDQVLLLYRRMLEDGVTPNRLTLVIALEACGNMAKKDRSYVPMALDIGRGLRCDIKRTGYMCDVLVGTALLNMYGKCGAVLDAETVFSSLLQRNIVTWTAMLSACMDQGEAEKALSLYLQMQEEGITSDDITFLTILQVCGEVGCLELCQQLHGSIVSVGFDKVPYVGASLIHGYGRCASMLNGQAVFANLAKPALESWNACIGGHSTVGSLLASIHVFEDLRMAGLNPDEETYVAILFVCSHSGSIIGNFQYLASMSNDHGLTPDVRHCASTADLWGRAGRVKEAYEWLKQMPVQADPVAWSSFLGACRIHGNVELARVAFEHMVRVYPKQVDAYVVLSNLCIFDGDELGG